LNLCQTKSNEFPNQSSTGSKGNAWLESTSSIKPTNESFQVQSRIIRSNDPTIKWKTSFQIIIEAVSGYTRNSDIAFDDVSLLTDEECEENDEDAKIPDTAEDDDGVFTVESCVNRCFEDKNSTVQLSANHTLSCSCAVDCDVKVSCCPDFLGEFWLHFSS
jgi:hypothetical protein